MTFSYSGDPSSSTKDQVRFYLGDTTETGATFSDEEITFALGQNSDKPLPAAIFLALSAAARYARYVTKSVGDLSISYGELATNFRTLATTLSQQLSMTNPPNIFSGGISVAGKRTEKLDRAAVQPVFARGQFDNKRR